MLKKDYYLVLGVTHEENLRGIQEAFRELAKRYHSDRAGPDGIGKFRDVQEAYEILSNPEKRKSYDDDLEQDEGKTPERIISRYRSQWEPLVPNPMSVLQGFETIRPSLEPLYERFLRNFTGKGIPKGERLQSLNVEVVLSDEEAMRGGILSVGVPVFFTCGHCAGSGRDWLFPCVNCNAQGIIEEERAVRVYIPLMTPDRSVIEVPIHGLGIDNFYLRLQIRISR
jgi:DnaJ-class molecular chaperone